MVRWKIKGGTSGMDFSFMRLNNYGFSVEICSSVVMENSVEASVRWLDIEIPFGNNLDVLLLKSDTVSRVNNKNFCLTSIV